MTDTTAYLVCLECGGRNLPGEQFCGNCGAYLAWESSSSETAGADAEEDATTPAPANGAVEDAATVDTTSAPPAPPATPAPPTEPAPPDADHGAVAGGPPAEAPQAAPVADAPALRRPTAAAPPRQRAPVAATPAEAPPAPGDLICPACGAGNRPERRFCRRCATQLTAAPVVAASVQPAAGARPKGRSTRFPFTAVLVLAVLIGLLVVAWLNRDVVIGFITSIVGFVFSSQSP